MSYQRVIPRDFFNESKLLKCMGQLSLKILDGKLPDGVKIEIDECGDPFVINQTNDGRLFLQDYDVTVNDVFVSMSTTYNDKNNYPLVCFHDDIETTVFDDNGEFTPEFIELCNNIE